MRVGSLFSGIGGLDLGLERAGMTVVWQSEIDAYASRVLAKHWPNVPNLGDITTIDWSTVEPVDLICGGYPCQPFSLAGARAGEDDARHLWPYFADAIRELRPRWALLENVPGHLSMGFDRVLGELAELGYDADWQCITAASIGAHHLRNRLFAVAHTSSPRRRQDTRSTPRDEGQDEGRQAHEDHFADGDGQGRRARDVADADTVGWDGRARVIGSTGWRQPSYSSSIADADSLAALGAAVSWRQCGPWAVEPDVRGIPDGLSEGLDGGLDGRDRIRAVEGATEASEAHMRAMRDRAQAWLASPRRGPDEQLVRELADALRELPHPMALGERQAGMEAARYVRGLRSSCEALGVVQHPLVPSQATWIALPSETQDWILLGASRGTWHEEWPGVARVVAGVPSRVDRLKCLGNAVVPQVAEYVGRRIMEAAVA